MGKKFPYSGAISTHDFSRGGKHQSMDFLAHFIPSIEMVGQVLQYTYLAHDFSRGSKTKGNAHAIFLCLASHILCLIAIQYLCSNNHTL